MIHLGIDPGKSGAIAILDHGKAAAYKMKDMTERDTWILLSDLVLMSSEIAVAYIELVHAMPKQGVSSTFAFGVSFGGLRMALVAAGIPFEGVTPAKWQRALGCLSKGDKNVTKAKAQELFPSVKVTHAIADALLIAEYCRREWK